MSAIVAALHLLLGTAYCGYGIMTAIEMRRDWRSFGFSHFGAAWIAMAFTCGPHHLFHAVHLGMEGRAGGPLDLLVVIVGLPAGVLWLYLRVEAFLGGPGDRFLAGTPRWLRAMGPLGFVYGAAVLVWSSWTLLDGTGSLAAIVPNTFLVGLYIAIGWVLIRTQLAHHTPMAGWSVSGVCLSVIFPTCASMHLVFASYAVGGLYHADPHGLLIDWLSVPAAAYFLWVVHGLYRDSLRDWNEGPQVLAPTPPESVLNA